MDEIDYSSLELGLALVFLGFLTFLSFFDSALHCLTSFDLKLLNEQHRKKGSKILELLSLDDLLIIIPLNFGIQLSSIGLAILTTHLVLLRAPQYPLLWAFALMVLLNLLFRQLIPRLFAHLNPEKMLLLLIPAFSYVFPVLQVLAAPITMTLDRVAPQESPLEEEKSRDVVKNEIQALIAIGKEEEVLEKDEGKLVTSVLEFGDSKAREVMTPRARIVGVPENATVSEVIGLMVSAKHSRIPVYREDLDHVIGFVHVRQLLRKLEERPNDQSIRDLLLPPVFISGDMLLSDLLREIKMRKSYMVFVRDDNGGIAGLLTIEDLLEEIVGEIYDEDQTVEDEIVPQEKDGYLVLGSVELDKVNDALEVALDDEDCLTIGGLVTKKLGRLPKKDDTLVIDGLDIKVFSADDRKVNRLLIHRVEQSMEPEGGAEGEQHVKSEE
ncbi:MAG TPA: hemolysin family protein [Thermodesulfobacteriota bacterium]|nr:HlyC/CorC family transporter [Deltaproteobacteria bacterium]HQO79011.1 hemolysin family protein [Thermodesulfobacteriota bacterium]